MGGQKEAEYLADMKSDPPQVEGVVAGPSPTQWRAGVQLVGMGRDVLPKGWSTLSPEREVGEGEEGSLVKES